MTDSETLLLLLRGEHISIAERWEGLTSIDRAATELSTDPRTLAAGIKIVVNFSENAIRHYRKWNFHLPGDLDGGRVVE